MDLTKQEMIELAKDMIEEAVTAAGAADPELIQPLRDEQKAMGRVLLVLLKQTPVKKLKALAAARGLPEAKERVWYAESRL